MTSTIPPVARSILEFWFGPPPLQPDSAQRQSALWWSGDKNTDFDIERRFGKLVQIGASGVFDSWMEHPESAVALIILLDQFPRSIYRGRAEAFEYDRKALSKTFNLIDSGLLVKMHPLHQSFALMPLQHSESIDDQELSVREFERLAISAGSHWSVILENYLDFARQHRDIVARFGRFPHRNHALGRRSTSEELDYLNSGAPHFGQ